MRISDWSSDVCSSDLGIVVKSSEGAIFRNVQTDIQQKIAKSIAKPALTDPVFFISQVHRVAPSAARTVLPVAVLRRNPMRLYIHNATRSEEHTSELQSLMRISYAVFCLKKKNTHKNTT